MAPVSAIAKRPATLVELRRYAQTNRGRATIRADMTKVALWAKRYGIAPQRLYVGEFGSLFTDNPASQKIRPDELRWLTAVRQEFERAGFAWAFFPMPEAGHLNYDRRTNFFKATTLEALGCVPGK